jgi:hypothetical protein
VKISQDFDSLDFIHVHSISGEQIIENLPGFGELGEI